MNNFKEFVKKNEKWFRGRLPETEASLNKVEKHLSLKLPSDIRWLLIEYGYWDGTGITNIGESVEETILAREHVGLPENYIVLCNYQDGGVILLDTVPDSTTGEYLVYDSGWESIPNDLAEEIIYPSLVEYMKQVIETETEENVILR